MQSGIKQLLREELKYKINENSLNNDERETVNYILGETLDEADGGEMYSRFINLLKSGKKALITTVVMTTLLSNASFSAELDNAPDNVKNFVTNIVDNKKNVDSNTKEINNDNIGKDEGSKLSINFSNEFNSGKYDLDISSVENKLKELKTYLLNNNNSHYTVKITASESQVPNQEGFKVGELAKKRSSVMKKVVDDYLNTNNIEGVDVLIKTRVGDVKWDGKNNQDNKYVNDQYVKLDLFSKSVSPCELNFGEQGKVASKEHNYISYEQELDEGGSIEIKSGTIPDRMVIRDNSNNIVSDTGYFSDSMHQYKEFIYVPSYVASLSEILKNEPSSESIEGLDENIQKFDNFNELLNFMKKDKNYKISSHEKRGEIINGVKKLKELWDSGQREFLFYTLKKGNVDFQNQNGKNYKVVVYSPIGKTGYSVKGNCD